MYLVSDPNIDTDLNPNARVALPLRRMGKGKYCFVHVPNWHPVGLYATNNLDVQFESENHNTCVVGVGKHDIFFWGENMTPKFVTFPSKFAWCYTVYEHLAYGLEQGVP